MTKYFTMDTEEAGASEDWSAQAMFVHGAACDTRHCIAHNLLYNEPKEKGKRPALWHEGPHHRGIYTNTGQLFMLFSLRLLFRIRKMPVKMTAQMYMNVS